MLAGTDQAKLLVDLPESDTADVRVLSAGVLGRRRPAYGQPALMLGGPLLGGKVRVALDRDPRILDIRYDLGHRRGDIGGLAAAADGVG